MNYNVEPVEELSVKNIPRKGKRTKFQLKFQ